MPKEFEGGMPPQDYGKIEEPTKQEEEGITDIENKKERPIKFKDDILEKWESDRKIIFEKIADISWTEKEKEDISRLESLDTSQLKSEWWDKEKSEYWENLINEIYNKNIDILNQLINAAKTNKDFGRRDLAKDLIVEMMFKLHCLANECSYRQLYSTLEANRNR